MLIGDTVGPFYLFVSVRIVNLEFGFKTSFCYIYIYYIDLHYLIMDKYITGLKVKKRLASEHLIWKLKVFFKSNYFWL